MNFNTNLETERSSYYDSDESRRSYQFRSDPGPSGADYKGPPLVLGCQTCGCLDSAWTEAGSACCGCRLVTPWPWREQQ